MGFNLAVEVVDLVAEFQVLLAELQNHHGQQHAREDAEEKFDHAGLRKGD